MSGSCTSICL